MMMKNFVKVWEMEKYDTHENRIKNLE